MDAKYINPFLVAIKNVFKTMIDVPFTLGNPEIKKNRTPSFEISSIIGLSGNVSGCVVINLSTPVALQLVSALLGDEVTEIDEDTIDAIGEIANMIAGNAKTDFPGENNAISVPTVVTGKHEVSYPSGLPIIAIPCETEAGRLVVEVALKAKE
jgi:chemotaxis protein CheX